jgi:hypothetical protein
LKRFWNYRGLPVVLSEEAGLRLQQNSKPRRQQRMNNPDAARQQAQREHNSNQGPANTNGCDANTRAAYEAERARLQKQQQEDANKRK